MKLGITAVFVSGFLLGLSVALASNAQQHTLTLSQRVAPLLRAPSVTELDWRLLRARLSVVEDQLNHLSDDGINSCCPSYRYDPARTRIVARFNYAPDTLNRLTLQEAKRRLSHAATSAIAAAHVELEQQPGASLETDDFEVEFVTFDEHAHSKLFAVYANEQLDLSNFGR